MTQHNAYIEIWYEHIRVLAGEIGPRGSTTDHERRASEYCANVFVRLGFKPRIESFTSVTSSYRLHLLVALSMLLSFTIYPLGGCVSAGIAAAVALWGMYSEVLELMFRDNPLRRFVAKGHSQNVIVTLPPTGQHQQDVVLIGHVDTNRTPLFFSSTRWVDFWRVVTPIMFFSFWGQIVLYTLGIVTQSPWIWYVSIESAACAALLAALTFHADLTPYSPGANDNASGAALVLTLAEHLVSAPLKHTRVWLVNTGCEEVKHGGAIHFFDRHRGEMHNPKVLAFEMLGCDGPAWLEREVIIPLFAYRADPDLIALVKQLACEHPEWRANPARVAGGHTEMADALRVGIPAITFIGVGPDGVGLGYAGPELYWHQAEDTPDKMNIEVMGQTYMLIWAYIQALDTQVN